MNPKLLLRLDGTCFDCARVSYTRFLAGRFRAILAFVLLGTVLSATAVRSAPASEVVTLRFLFLDESGGAYSLKSGQGYTELGEQVYAIGPAVTVSAGERPFLYRETPDPAGKNGQPRREKIAAIVPPAGAASSLVVVTALPPVDAGASPAYSLSYYNNSTEVFPTRSIRILNLGQVSVAARFSSSEVLATPGSSQIVRPEIDTRNRVRTKAAVQTPSGWQMLYDSLTIVRPRQRVTCLCVYSPSGMKHTYYPEELAKLGPPPPGHFWLTYTDVL